MKKYPRTYHLSFSPEVHSDDKVISGVYQRDIFCSSFVITVKLDGGNCCIKPLDGVFARTHTQPTNRQSFNYIKNRHYYSKLDILNPNYHYFGENMYAIHSIEYKKLKDYFYIFNIFDTKNSEWLSWDEVVEEALRCDFLVVPVLLIEENISEKEIKKLMINSLSNSYLGGEAEGFVIREAKRITKESFSSSIAKFVRENHVQTDEHWSRNWKQAKLMI